MPRGPAHPEPTISASSQASDDLETTTDPNISRRQHTSKAYRRRHHNGMFSVAQEFELRVQSTATCVMQVICTAVALQASEWYLHIQFRPTRDSGPAPCTNTWLREASENESQRFPQAGYQHKREWSWRGTAGKLERVISNLDNSGEREPRIEPTIVR